MSSKILLRRGTAAEWSSANPILGTGELGIETDTLKIKIGNGSSTWSQLSSYANVTPAQLTSQINSLISAAPATLDTLNELAAAINNDASFSTTVNNLLTGKVSKSGGDTITSSTASTVGIIIKGAASQTADLQQWQNSAGEVQVSIKPTSNLTNVLKFTEQYSFAINWGNEAILSTSSGELVVSPYGLERVALIVKGKASQTDNLQEWQNSAGTTLAIIDSAGNWFNNRMYLGAYALYDSRLNINTLNASDKGIVIRGVTSQTGNLQEWQNTGGTVLASVSSVGNFYVGNTFSNFGGQTINGGYVTIAGSLPAIKPLLIRGAASQTANLQEWQRSDGTILSSVSSDGTATLGSMQITAGTHKAYGPFEILNNASGNSAFSIIGFGQLANGSLTIGIKDTDNANNRNWQLAVGGGAYAGQSGNFLGEGGLLFIEKNPNDSSSADRAGFRRGGQFALGGLNTYSASLSVTPLSTSTIGQVIRANASQTANLQEWQNSNGTVLSRVDSGGIGRFTYFRIGSSLDGLYTTSISNPAANLAGLAIRGADAQSANLQEWQNSSGTVLAKVDSAGSITAANYNLSNSLYNIKKTLKKTIDPAQNAIAGNTYDLFQIQFSSSLQGIFTMQVSIRNGGYGQSMSYTLPATYVMDWLSQYGITNPFTDSNTWVDLTPITFAPRHLMTNDYLKFQARVNSNTIFFRIKLTGQLTSNPLFDVYIQHSEEFANSTVTELSSTGTDFTTSGVLPNFLSSKAGTTAIFNPLTITSSVASNVPLIIKGAASQTGDLQQWQNSTGTVMVKILSDGSQTWYNASNGATIASISPYGEIYAQGNIYVRNAANYGASINITTPTTTHIGAVIRSISGQTANLQEWQNSSGTVLAKVESTGIFNVNNIANSTLTTALVMDNSGVGTGTGTQIIFRYGGVNYASISSVYSGSPTGADMIFNVGSTGAARMRIDANGNVGINQLLPGQKLDVVGAGRFTGGAYAANQAVTHLEFVTGSSSSGFTHRIVGNTDSAGTPRLSFQTATNATGGSSEVLSIRNDFGSVYVTPYSLSSAGLIVKGFTSQTANLQEWQNSAGTVHLKVAANGDLISGNNTFIGAAYGQIMVRGATDYGASVNINTGYLGTAGLIIRGQASQTANLQEWQNSAGTVLGSIGPTGSLTIASTTANNTTIFSAKDANNNKITVNSDASNRTFITAQSNISATSLAGAYFTADGFEESWFNLNTRNNTAGQKYMRFGNLGNKFLVQRLNDAANVITSTPFTIENTSATNSIYVNSTGTIINGSTALGQLTTYAASASTIGLVIRGAASQTANLQEWQDSAGTVMGRIDGQYGTIRSISGIDLTNTYTGATTITARVHYPNTTPISIIGAASQTANLQEWQDSAGGLLANVSSDGAFSNTGNAVMLNISRTTDNAKIVYFKGASFAVRIGSEVGLGAQVEGVDTTNGLTSYQPIRLGGSTTALHTGGLTKLLINSSGNVLVNGFTASTVGLTVKGAASQTAYLQDWQNSAGTSLVSVSSDGTIRGGGSFLVDGTYGITNIRAATLGASLNVGTGYSAQQGIIVRGAASQTSNLQEWQSSTGEVGMLFNMGNAGDPSTLGFSVSRSWAIKWGAEKILSTDSGGLVVTPYTTDRKVLVVKGVTSQTANLQEWQDSTGAIISKLDPAGGFTTGTPATTNIKLDATAAGAKLHFGTPATFNNYATLGAYSSVFNIEANARSILATVTNSTTTPTLIVKANTAQTVDLQQWQNSAGTVLSNIRADGTISASYFDNPAASGSYLQASAGTSIDIIARVVGQPTFRVKGAASQTANLQEWQNSAGSAVAYMSPAGRLTLDWVTSSVLLSNYLVHPTDTGPYFYLTSTNTSLTNRTSASNTVFTVKGMASQSGDLQQWQNNSGTVLAKITASGALDVTAITVNGAAITSTPTTSDVELMNIMGAY